MLWFLFLSTLSRKLSISDGRKRVLKEGSILVRLCKFFSVSFFRRSFSSGLNPWIIGNNFIWWFWSQTCCSVTQSCSTLCDPMNCSTPDSPVLHYLLVGSNSCPLSRWCHPTISSSIVPFSSFSQSSPSSGSFPVSRLIVSGDQSIRASASASVLPMNIQDWFPLGLTSLIFLLSKGLSRVFFSTTVQKHQVRLPGFRLFICHCLFDLQQVAQCLQISHLSDDSGKNPYVIRSF